MRRLLTASLLTAALLVAGAAAAQPAPQADRDRDIVVTGEKQDDRIRQFVRALTDAHPRGQLVRFEWKACPVVIGLSEPQEDAVADRMRRVAENVGIPLAGLDCRPNILVAVTKDRPAFVKELSRQLPMLVPFERSEKRKLLGEPLATAWHVKGPPLSADGHPLRFARYQYLDPMSGTLVRSTQPVYVNETTRRGSRITAPVRLQFSAAVVVVDADALAGLGTTQLADYAAMRAFAQTDPAQLPAGAPESILKVLDVPMGAAAPLTMTRWDRAFLRGLYASRPDLLASAQRSDIGRRMKEDLGEGSKE